MMNGDIFLAGMITGVLLCAMISVAFGFAPRRKVRRRGGDESWVRAIDDAYDAGRQRGREESISGLTPRPRQQVLTMVRRTDRGWMGTTAAVAGLTSDDGKGAA